MPNSSTPTEYRTSDLLVATALAYYEFKILRIERASQAKSIFIFEEEEKRRQEILTKLTNRELRVEPQKWEDTKKHLKTLILNYY